MILRGGSLDKIGLQPRAMHLSRLWQDPVIHWKRTNKPDQSINYIQRGYNLTIIAAVKNFERCW